MKLQDVILKAIAKKITWMDAAEIAGVSDRTMRRIKQRYEQFGYTGLLDQRRGHRSTHRIRLETAEKVLALYQEKYFDLNVRHFVEKLREEHAMEVSYTWVYQALVGAGLVRKRRKRARHRRRRERRPLPGMLLHIDGSKHGWLNDDRWYDLIVVLDDATSEIYYAQLVVEESTRTVMAALREVIETQGLFCALYSDRGSHFWVTAKAGEKVDKQRLTQVGRALRELGVQMIPAYSPQARGRSERNFGTWQGRLPQELRLAGITTVAQANRFLRESYIGTFNEKFRVAAAQKGTAFRRCSRTDLDWVFTVQTERVVDQDNTVAIRDRYWQIEKSRFRHTLAGCTVTIHEHLDGRISIRYGPHVVARFDAAGQAAGQGCLEKRWRREGRGQSACGSKELGSPPFPFPPSGASGGHRRLRYATARAQRRPKAKRQPAFWAGKENMPLYGRLRRPKPPALRGM